MTDDRYGHCFDCGNRWNNGPEELSTCTQCESEFIEEVDKPRYEDGGTGTLLDWNIEREG